MRTKTFNEIVQAVIRKLSLVPGSSTQIYAEDIITTFVQDAFDELFAKAWWDAYMERVTATLDGTSGLVTTTLTDIENYSDIRYVYRADSDIALPRLPTENFNPIYRLSAGSTPKYIEPNYADTDKHFIVWPKTATGDVDILYRKRPADFVLSSSDDITFDSLLLEDYATYMYLEDDGTNPGATEKYKIKAENRLSQLMDNESSDVIQLDPSEGNIPYDWQQPVP